MSAALDAALAAEIADWEARGLRRTLGEADEPADPSRAPGVAEESADPRRTLGVVEESADPPRALSDAEALATPRRTIGVAKAAVDPRRALGAANDPANLRREFASNDYLSLARDPRVIEAAREALACFGAGGRAARLLGGGCPLDRAAEQVAADWLGAEAALLFPSGYQANLGVVGALAGRGDALICDEANHASLIDAASLSRARVLVHRHLDLEDVERCLRAARGARRRLVLTESVFSMDGDAAPLGELDELCLRHDAWLVVDEAHAIGLLGRDGAGGWSALDLDGHAKRGRSSRLAARMLTGGKALGANGAFVVGSRTLRELLLHRARSFVFTTALSPAVSGALVAAIAIARDAATVRAQVLELARSLAAALGRPSPAAAIVPWIAGPSARAVDVAAALARRGFDVRAVRPPTVAEGTARLRIACHAHNDRASIAELAAALRAACEEHSNEGRSAHEVQLRRVDVPPPTSTRAKQSPARSSTREPIRSHPATAVFVVGTDTDVGKTVVAALLARAAVRRGATTYWKPVQTGSASDTDEVARLTGTCAAVDADRLGATSRPQFESQLALHAKIEGQSDPMRTRVLHRSPARAPIDDARTRFDRGLTGESAVSDAPRFAAPSYLLPLAASPHEAARSAGVTIELARLRARLCALQDDAATGMLIVELAGGLLVPYDDAHTQADWLALEALPIVLVARSGLGTLNHTLLSLEALAARRLLPRALFLVGPKHAANRATLARHGGVAAIHEVERFEPLEPAALERWIDAHDLTALFESGA